MPSFPASFRSRLGSSGPVLRDCPAWQQCWGTELFTQPPSDLWPAVWPADFIISLDFMRPLFSSSDFTTLTICSESGSGFHFFFFIFTICSVKFIQSIVVARKCVGEYYCTLVSEKRISPWRVSWVLRHQTWAQPWMHPFRDHLFQGQIQSHALILVHSPIFGLLFLYQPLSGWNLRPSSLESFLLKTEERS